LKFCVKILFCKHYLKSRKSPRKREGSGSGSVPLTNGSGSGSGYGRPKKSGSPTLAGRIGDVRWTNLATGKKHDLSFTFSCPIDGIVPEHIDQCRPHFANISTADESAAAVCYIRNVVVIILIFIYPETCDIIQVIFERWCSKKCLKIRYAVLQI
jgi:hypothetical protein